MRELFDETWFFAPLHDAGEVADLPREESHHLRRVLRVPPGARIRVVNGMGTLFECSTEDAGGGVRIRAEGILEQQPRPALSMALAVLKGRDLEEPVEGLCQLNLDRIELVICDHSQVFKGQDFGKMLERLRQKSTVSSKQAKKAWLTRILDPVPFRDWLRQNSASRILAALPGPDRLGERPREPFQLLVGPEGGFSRDEMSALAHPSIGSLGLGPTRIRATHAPLVAAGKLMGLGWI